jgi:hypothetical protein
MTPQKIQRITRDSYEQLYTKEFANLGKLANSWIYTPSRDLIMKKKKT